MKKKEELNYFDEFAKSVEISKSALLEVKEYINNFNYEQSKDIMIKIHKLENDADNNLHKLRNFLIKDFLPPIDREDIIEISDKLDDLIDDIDEISININILNITQIEIDLKNMLNLLETTINELYNLILSFRKFKDIENIKSKIIEVNKLEENADRLYENAIKKLFSESKNSIDILKWSKIYEIVEDCFDTCENIADCVEEILMKNG